jgi:hypothetical protein
MHLIAKSQFKLKGHPPKTSVVVWGKKDFFVIANGLIILGGFWKETEKFWRDLHS